MEQNKNYTWSPEETFSVSGLEIGALNRFVDMVLSSEMAQIVTFATECKAILNMNFKKALDEGKLKEADIENTK